MLFVSLTLLCSVLVPCLGGTVQFEDTTVLAQEGKQLNIRIRHVGDVLQIVNAVVSVDNINQDFVGSSQVASFAPGGSDVATVTFMVANDNEPEIEETYMFTLSVIGSVTTVTLPNIATVIIEANDDAYGVFSFTTASPMLVDEDPIITMPVDVTIGRALGTFGRVTVAYRIESDDPTAVVSEDISPTTGSVTFESGETTAIIQLQVQTDTIPENAEEFRLVLTSAMPGARVQDTQFSIVIKANDAPVNFQQPEMRFDEGPVTRLVSLTVHRGLEADGVTPIGAVDFITTINYNFLSLTAVIGQDFRGPGGVSSGQLVFPANERKASITLEIMDDTEPEVEERFQVILSSSSTPSLNNFILTAPSKADVIINANDNPAGILSFRSPNFISPPTQQINEDEDSDTIFSVIRTAGSFGVVTVQWEIVRNDTGSGEVTLDLTPVSGTVTFGSGERERPIIVSIVSDDLAEPAERFLIRLLPETATGDAKVEGIKYGLIIIEDSDNVYGEVQFGTDVQQKLIINAIPRMLQLTLSRTGANIGDLHVNLSVSYTPAGDASAEVLEDTDVATVIFTGQSEVIEHIHLLSSAFIQVGGVFTAELTNVFLVTPAPIGSYNSPRLGPRTTTSITVTAAEANGEIGFTVHNYVVNEPVDSPSIVSLRLSREGVSGDATITWVMAGSGTQRALVTDQDVGQMTGTVLMQSGMSETNIEITIMPDDVPELDEELTVTLTNVEPNDTQRLKPGATSRTVTISENDNPGGVFQFAGDAQLSYELEEGGSPLQVTVVREDGDLLTQSIQYIIDAGENDFYGATNVLTFPPGVRSRQFSLAAKVDGIPELEEVFTLRLQNYGNGTAVIGSRSSISVKVMKNDAPHGVVQFTDTVIYLNESKNRVTEVATVNVSRSSGLFGSVQVTWSLDPSDDLDLRPSTGFVTFNSDQDVAFINLESVSDDITEAAESFTLTLSNPQGGAVIGQPSSVTVTILQNDYPLYFVDTTLDVEEPTEASVTLQRDGPTDQGLTVRYITVDGTARAGDGDYVAMTTGSLTFNVGEVQRSISVRVLDDATPEGSEMFYLKVYEILGDAVITGPDQVNITILDNDEAYGVFHFKAPFSMDIEEGSTARYAITRDGGTFGGVQVDYELYFTATNQKAVDGGDFMTATGLNARFEIGEKTKYIELTPRIDNEPENDKTYSIRLTKVTVFEGRQDVPLARLADGDTSALLTILASDDPNGRFGFPIQSKQVSVAEDFYPGMASTATVNIDVQRRMGIYGTVEVMWEVYSDKVAGTLPVCYDLIFQGTIPSNLMLVPSKRRSRTGTHVVSFTGNTGGYISVSALYQPPYSDIGETFSLAAWVQPFSNTDGYILAKTNPDGSRHFYTLKLVTSSLQCQLVLGYSITGANENLFMSVTYLRNIEDTMWHHIVVSVDKSIVNFYIDGTFIGTKSLAVSQVLIDNTGQLTVGAIYPGTDQFSGYLQDVRVYTTKISEDAVQELYVSPAQLDVSPISGYLTYPVGDREGTIDISTVSDLEEESDEVFTVRLVAAKGGATLSQTDNTATLTVLKSDNANGLFYFLQPCVPVSPPTENDNITCTVARQRGDDGRVVVTWATYQIVQPGNQTTLAKADFVEFTGQVVFEAGERSKTFRVWMKDDNIPESQETFEIRLVETATEDGLVGSTNTSGASIDKDNSVSKVMMKENDSPNGLVQFSTALIPPGLDDPYIQPALERPTIRVAEESGIARLLVVRAQGYQGEITVEWRTTDGTARSSGKTPPDYSTGVGRLTMQDGQRYTYIDVAIVDNNLPEDEKTFVVSLLNPSGGAVLGVGSVVTVVIDHSDGAFGIFQFSEGSLGIQVEETGDSSFNVVNIQIERVGGNIGLTEVAWEVTSDKNNDIVDHAGNVTFQHGQLTSDLGLKVRGDTEAELDELFIVQLMAVSRGELGPSAMLRSEVTILANDDVYGKFVFPENMRPISVEESDTRVQMTIERRGGSFGVVEVNYTTLTPTETFPFIPSTIPRAGLQDYKVTSGSVRFQPGQLLATFDLEILDDLNPEEDEVVYVRLTGVRLVEGAQIRPVDGSPILGSNTESYGQIIIKLNDNANGELVLSPLSPRVPENQSEPFLFVTRFGGAFGEVIVSFTVTDGTAKAGLDYVVLSNQVRLARGEMSAAVPIRILDDTVPEMAEGFLVQLDQVSGGGTLGSTISTNVIIDVSDDPNGAFEFLVPSLTIDEPDGGPITVNVTVVRRGGTLGVVTLTWVAKLGDAVVKDDISPTSGSIFFVSNEVGRQILISVLPDDLPEGQEDIRIELESVTNGGRIGEVGVFTLSILSNDNPHGVVQFSDRLYTLEERGSNSVQGLKLLRTGGSFGQLRVYYSTGEVTLLSNIDNSVEDVLTYYTPPQSGTAGIQGESVTVDTTANITLACATACLVRLTCKSFEVYITSTPPQCTVYPSAPTEPLIVTAGIHYYVKEPLKAGELTGVPATPGDDYVTVTNGYVLIDAGVMEGSVPITVQADITPELDEKLLVYLTRVDVEGDPPSPANSPFLGELRNVTVTIRQNDDTYGAFNMYSDNPLAIDGGLTIQVEEKDNLAVDLIVERTGGSIGQVSVQWSIDTVSSTAIYGIDYRADGATLTFTPGETRKLISVTILDDTVPELTKTVVVKLTSPLGGATLHNDTVTIVILESDNVAGVISLNTTSVLAKEGDTMTLAVLRSPAQFGTVVLDWFIQGLNGLEPGKGFQQTSGTLQFLPNENQKFIVIDVLADNIPEINEEYQLQLVNVKTTGVGVSGSATFDPQLRTATITIEGSNNPHGVVQFGSNSLNVRINEDSAPVNVQLDRKFGAIGTIRVDYEITQGSVSLTNEELVYAEPSADFVSAKKFIDLEDGVSSASVVVTVIDDDIPEVDEVFVVRLLSVALINQASAAEPPVLGSTGTVSQVIINANDGTKGEVVFTQESATVSVVEVSGNISLTVMRERGTFGDVSVFFYAQSIVQGTNLGLDYKITPQELVFLNGVTTKQIHIEILNDEIPEPDETFQVILSNPKNGLVLGQQSRATVTILANDDAGGFVYFESDDLVTLDEPQGDTSLSTTADLVILRGPGMYGVVNVPYEIIPEIETNRDDLSPMQGTLTFDDLQTSVTLTLSVLDDEQPEDAERFTVRLLLPDNEAKLGTKTERTVLINSNDSPNGLLSLYAAGTRLREISVEEGAGMLKFEVVRTQGLEGHVTVDVATEPGTAETTADVNNVDLVPVQVMNTTNVGDWYSYIVNGTDYILMFKSSVVGELNSDLGSPGSAGAVDMATLMYTTLFRWQGELIPVQTVETDGISSALSIVIGTQYYLVITNKGNHNRYQTQSRLYKVNTGGTLTLLQNLDTSGATDVVYFTKGDVHYLVIANSLDNTANSNLATNIWRWEPSNQRFTKVSSLRTLGASALSILEIEDTLFLAVANNYDSEAKSYQIDSKIYKFDAQDQFSQHQSIPTLGAMDVAHIKIRALDLLVFANNRDNTVSSPQQSDVYRWDTVTQMFVLHERLETNRVNNLEVLHAYDDTVYAIFANTIGASEIYAWNVQSNTFQSVWTGSQALSLVPIVISQVAGDMNLVAMANKNITTNPVLYQLIKVKDSDFAPRTVTMTMREDEDILHVSMVVLQETLPENTETFYVTLRSPTGGAEIGINNRIAVNILSNDNAHGIIEISRDSLELQEQELIGQDNPVSINVIRHQGYYGRVTVKWVATGDHDGTNDITPLEGIVEFPEGQSVASISITIRDDDIAELQEVTYIQLSQVVEGGTSLTGRGAQIGQNRTSKLTVLANDSPYGVVKWERTRVTATEPEGTDSTVILFLVREQGQTGELQVSYITQVDKSSPPDEQAISGEDYISRQGMAIFQDGINRVPVEMVIKQDATPEADEVFLVNITRVVLLGQTPVPGSEPSVRIPGNIVAVTIEENDNARGIVQFNVTTNIEGRIDTYEEFGTNTTIPLAVTRSVGMFGGVTVLWQAEPREATILDYSPTSGTLSLADTQDSAVIYITVLDDDVPEEMETFDVKLISVTGGAVLGPYNTVRIAILKNDSPNGLFRFVTSEVIAHESLTPTDPDGEVRLVVERVQGSEGVVHVQWRLNAEAVYDFYTPHSGTMVFSQGEKTKSLLLRTKPDTILEGEERFRVSLITADNNADISHTQGDASIIMMPDPGASGTISIMPGQRTVYIGEPGESTANYNGQVQIVLTRGAGIYGDVAVTWSITPRDEAAFLQVEGTVSMVDLQQKAAITLQALDDTIPELRAIYTLQLNSATGGAILSPVSRATTADIVFVASDHPHGVFVFDLPETYITTEDSLFVQFPVVRRSGLNGQVFVTYKTHPGTAVEREDYFPEEGTLTFQHGQNQQFIDIQLKQDNIPEGLEYFYLNLTSTRLVEPSSNNYSIVNGLQLDMRPSIGSLGVKQIMIERNDNAEGTIQFTSDALHFRVTEESGVAKIPMIRNGGNFGRVSAVYMTYNESATEGIDYIQPAGTVVFDDGQSEAFIEITIRDDSVMEYQEVFKVQLTSATDGALLGDNTLATVTIAKSDYPNGRFGFKGQLEIKIDNPATKIERMFTVERTAGLLGEQTVNWRILGPNNPVTPLQETNDIAFIDGNRELTSGALVWQAEEAGERTFTLDIKPFSSWEIEKVFVIEIEKVTGFPVATGNGEVSPTTGKVTLSISKFGHPNGIVQFDGPAQLQREVEEPEGVNTLTLMFPLHRRQDTGTVGNIQVFWEIQGPVDEISDIEPRAGSVLVEDGERPGDIEVKVLSDTVPELTETYRLVITKIEGGAEIDTQYNVSTFSIRYNDQPHGVFGIIPQYQTVVVDPVDLSRHVRLNFTRYAGTFGSVILTFSLQYDIPQSGIVLSLSDGTVTFAAGEANNIAEIGIEGTGFLALDTTFSVSLVEIQYLGAGVTDEPPKFQAGQTEAKVTVPAIAANSRVGFHEIITTVHEETSTSRLTLVREGVYGTLEVSWQSGFPEGRVLAGYVEGAVVPTSSSVVIPHGVDSKNFTIQLSAKYNTPELFAVHLPVAPSTTVAGGARLQEDRTVVRIEPHGLLRFATNSTSPSVSEMFGKIYLQVLRVYGSEGKLEATYRAEGISAGEFDFTTIQNHVVVMEPGQTSSLIMIQVMQDNKPEQAETFHVNLTSVEKFPTSTTPSVSPRISYMYQSSKVTILESNDPYGVLSIEPETITVQEIYQQLNLTVTRTGGDFGTVRCLVRTVGGGEDWTSQIVVRPDAQGNDTITEILGNRDRFTSAVGGTDYVVLDTVVEFKQGELIKTVSVTILSDDMAEPAETVLVYLTQPTGGARIAAGEPDGGNKGYSVITIAQNDLSNGKIGFSPDSLSVSVDEDLGLPVTMKLARTDAFFGEVEISWKAKVTEDSDDSADVVLSSQLERTAATAKCPGKQEFCYFNITLINDQKPEEEHSFVIVLMSVKDDAELNQNALVAMVTIQASDDIRGLIEFTHNTRMVIVSNLDNKVTLQVRRMKGQGYRVEVGYRTMMMTSDKLENGVMVNPALAGADYSGQTGSLIFEAGREELQSIDINLTPFTASKNALPKQFHVNLQNPTNGAHINEAASHASILIVDVKDVGIWTIIKDTQDTPLTDDTISNVISELDAAIQVTDDVTNHELTLLETMVDDIIIEGLDRKIPTSIINQLLTLMCKLLSPDKNDATRGRYKLAELMEKIAYMLVTNTTCPSPTPPTMASLQCVHAKIAAGRWPLAQIQGYQYPGQRKDEFKVPNVIPNPPPSQGTDCADFHMIEYSSEQWFMNTDEKQLLSNKVISFGLKGRDSSYSEVPATFRIHSPDRRIATRQAQCVYYETGLKMWVSPKEVCQVTNDLDLGTDDYVDCSCKHLTHYAVKATTSDPGLVGYSVWFYVSCFICMTGLVLAILAHHVCSISAMFSASLLMHMCFAAMATQICYVVAAYLSTDEIIVYTLDQDNYRCIVMSLFLHYFFMAQFSWMMTQAINFWKILVLNDEHTDRKYVLFFLLGWGLPVVIMAVFYVVTFNLYRYVYDIPYDFIYGDVNNNGDICFITNPYAALGGVIVPVLLMLLVVAVVFVKSFQVTPQWQAYDDIYRGRYNISEIRTLLLFWAVIIITWLWGGLHLVYGHLWMLIMFCIFNIIQGLMALILYSLLRNPCLVHCFSPKRGATSYTMNSGGGTIFDPARPPGHTSGGTGQYQFHPATLDVASLKGSRASLLNESWERDSIPSRSTMKVKRTLPQGGNLYIDPPVYRQNTISESKDFDDLLYALKTGGSFTPSDINSEDSDNRSEVSSKIDKYELRRIDIADTHL